MQILQPPGWEPPKGYSNGIVANGRFIFVAGQVGTDGQMRLVGPGFVDQAGQALRNIVAVLKQGGAGPEHLVRLTWYVTDMMTYLISLKELGRVCRGVIGNHYPVRVAFGDLITAVGRGQAGIVIS